MPDALKRIAKRLTPPIIWDVLHRAKQRRRSSWHAPNLSITQASDFSLRTDQATSVMLSPAPSFQVRVARNLEELDKEIAWSDDVRVQSEDALLKTFCEYRFELPRWLPNDPYSDEYREIQMDLYRRISGRESYAPSKDERTLFDLQSSIDRPYPYQTNSPTIVGNHLMAIGFLMRVMAAPAYSRILEFGMGWGKSTFEFAQMTYEVTAVDVDPEFIELNRERFRRFHLPVNVIHSDMLLFDWETKFDRVVFYECFHHCSDPPAMIRKLNTLVAEGGSIIFAGEPIMTDFPMPWGIRTDGQSIWSIRKFGWLELGFQTGFFLDLLDRNGWQCEEHVSQDVTWQRVFVAKRKG